MCPVSIKYASEKDLGAMHVGCVFLGLFVFVSLRIVGKTPEDGRGSALRKGQGDNRIFQEVETHITFEENNGKAFRQYKLKDKNPQGQKTNKWGINQAKYSAKKAVVQQNRIYLQKKRFLPWKMVTEKDLRAALDKEKNVKPCSNHQLETLRLEKRITQGI